MFGAFRPTAPRSVGLLWKIPWRLSAPQKLRHRRRLRRVDNIVAVLDNALKRQSISSAPQSPSSKTSNTLAQPPRSTTSPSTSSSKPVRPTTVDDDGLATNAPASQTSTRTSGSASSKPSTNDIPSLTTSVLARWKASMPTEAEMLPRDKYTIFDKKVRGYRKGVHKLPKWTRMSQRVNPPGF